MSYTAIDRKRVRAVRQQISDRVLAAAPVVWRIAKSAAAIAGATALAAAGGAMAIFGFIEARKPDEVLLRAAIKAVAPPSANDERDLFLGILIVGVTLAIIGVGAIGNWWKTPTK
jgi:hypothetical protein